eukprot:TRINITY_DN17033_c0_g1_i1.p2 TRINITY_DN17033_c0_g1~~TRINITY_DN17033_c0_g1_i1.p2  ORF type:complete len:134 (+),score=32.01 TRINITY_DN17033_c0_g1_i1:64-465(+)
MCIRDSAYLSAYPGLTKLLPGNFLRNLNMHLLFFGIMRPTLDPNILREKQVEFLSHKLNSCIAVGAGYDAEGSTVASLENLGFGYVEIGSCTPAEEEQEKYRIDLNKNAILCEKLVRGSWGCLLYTSPSPRDS